MANKEYKISDELLAAFIEGNVNSKELKQVLQVAANNAELQETLNIAMQVDDDMSPMMQMAAESGRNLCDIECEAYILKQNGVNCEIEALLEVAKENHWIRRAGTPLNCIGNLLEYNGLNVCRRSSASVDDIKEVLTEANEVIVAVDSDKLYPERPDEEDATNHAVVVTKIEDDKVTIFDPANIEEVKIDMPLFLSAWHESQNYMVSVVNV